MDHHGRPLFTFRHHIIYSSAKGLGGRHCRPPRPLAIWRRWKPVRSRLRHVAAHLLHPYKRRPASFWAGGRPSRIRPPTRCCTQLWTPSLPPNTRSRPLATTGKSGRSADLCIPSKAGTDFAMQVGSRSAWTCSLSPLIWPPVSLQAPPIAALPAAETASLWHVKVKAAGRPPRKKNCPARRPAMGAIIPRISGITPIDRSGVRGHGTVTTASWSNWTKTSGAGCRQPAPLNADDKEVLRTQY
jgi:hypothetical protein